MQQAAVDALRGVLPAGEISLGDPAAELDLRDRIRVTHAALRDFHPREHLSAVLCIPTYGERFGRAGDDIEPAWRDLDDFLRCECAHATACILSGNPALGHSLRLRADRKIPIHKSPIDCRSLRYEIGALRSVEPEGTE